MPTLKSEAKSERRPPVDDDRNREDNLLRVSLQNAVAIKKYQKWLSFATPRVVLGFEQIPKEYQPNQSTKPRGLALCFEKVQGWTIPYQLYEDMDVKGYEVSVQLSLSMFHTVSRSFFGSTWMGASIQLSRADKDNLDTVVDFDYNDLLYVITRLQDKSCVAVIEIVASTIDKENDVLVSQHGCGWTMLTMFASQFTDISSGYDEGKSMSSTLFAGSPRDLIMKSDALNNLREISGCALHYRIFESWKLLKIQNLVAENAVLGRFDIIAGLKSKLVTLPDEIRKKRLACIGDKEEMLGKSGVRVLPCTPQLAPSMTLSLVDWHLLIPDRSRFESRVRVKTTTHMQLQQGAAESQIISRVLKIGLHNGHTLINKENEWVSISLEEDEDDKDVLLLPSTKTMHDIEGYIPHENVALVFVVEYEVGIFKPQATQYDMMTTIEAIFGDNDVLRTTVTIGATAHVPFDGQHFQLKNNSDDDRDDEDNDEELNIELDLLPNQLCQLLSQNLIFKDEDHRQRVLATQAKAVTNVGGISEPPDGSGSENAVIGFDLKVFNRRRKEFHHLDSAGESEDEQEDVEDYGDDKGDDDTRRRRPRFEKTSKFVKSERTRGHDDDALSMASEPSLVGGSSATSSLRLDPQYYSAIPQYSPRAPVHRQHSDPNLQLPAGRASSLLARSMETHLEGSSKLGKNNIDSDLLRERRHHREKSAEQRSVFSDESGSGFGRIYDRRQREVHHAVDHRARADVKDLSRAARSRLSRHGFSDAIGDSVALRARQSQNERSRLPEQRLAVDVEAEAKDELNIHEINIQFAGYRAGYPKEVAKVSATKPSPRCVFFSFQFFTCKPTRTEVMRLLPSKNTDEFSVLVRDEATSSRHEAPLVLRYIVNAAEVSPLEAVEFAEYLAHGTLYVDVWDADSLLHIGTCALPLHRLLRQGQSVVKSGLESNVINSESCLRADRGGLYTTVIADGSAPAGLVVGAINVLLANYGQKGRMFAESKDAKMDDKNGYNSDSRQHVEGLNWRAADEKSDSKERHFKSKYRPKIKVRAKPLAESAPDLHKALKDHRIFDDARYSGRSLSAIRGNAGAYSLTYDDIMVLFKRFQGSEKGKVQYSGPLMKLLDLPNSSQALRKFFKLHKMCIVKGLDMKKLLMQYADGRAQLTVLDFKEFLRDTFEKCAISSSLDETAVIAQHVYSTKNRNFDTTNVMTADDIHTFCAEEAERQDWVVTSRRLLRTVQKAYLANVDVEQELAEMDHDGSHVISVSSFQRFLKELSRYGKLGSGDITTAVKHFRRAGTSNAHAISLRDFVSFIGKRYVGNLKARLREMLCKAGKSDEGTEPQSLSTQTILLLSGAQHGGQEVSEHVVNLCNAAVSYADLEDRLQQLHVFNDLTHEQVRRLLSQVGSVNGITVVQLLDFLDIPHQLTRKDNRRDEGDKFTDMSVEELLKLLLEKCRADDGLSFDQTFRYFDSDGTGAISEAELESGIEQLNVFNNIAGWRKQIPEIARRFDTDGDGQVSLKEFFAYFGCKEYIPNMIQRLTMIFATANIPLNTIFGEFDADGSGYLACEELTAALKSLGGSFEELTEADTSTIIAHFDSDGDGKISQKEFVTFFDERVKVAKRERKAKALQRFRRRFKLVLMAVIEDGGSIEEIFDHFNKDKDGAISRVELVSGLKSMPHFEKLTQEELDSLLSILDKNNDGSISFQEFKNFIVDAGEINSQSGKKNSRGKLDDNCDKSREIIDRLHRIVKSAEKKGASANDIFGHLDKNRDGSITLKELHLGLKKIPFFAKLNEADYVDLFYALDEDDSGEISIQEFIDVVVKGDLPVKKNPRVENVSESKDGNENERLSKPNTDKEAVFIRLFNNSSRSEGGLTGLLAQLDDDEDGLISLTMLLRYCRREMIVGGDKSCDRDGNSDCLDERDVENLIESITRKDGFIRVDSLLAFFRKGTVDDKMKPYSATEYDPIDDEADDNIDAHSNDYEFSNNPETLVLEKKLRQLGRQLSKKGTNIERLFREYDARYSGMIRRTEFLEVLSKLGLYILEKGAGVEEANLGDGNDIDLLSRRQQKQVSRIKQGGRGGEYSDNAYKAAARLYNINPNHSIGGGFKEHTESMAMINWYRQGQKRMLLQRVLSHSLATVIHIYPRFATTQFFEFPLTNPFGHEERFIIEVSDPELRVVTGFDEWVHLRSNCRPCYGQIGEDPVEAEMFDTDSAGSVQVALLPQETLTIPFSFITFEPYFSSDDRKTKRVSRAGESKDDNDDMQAPSGEIPTSRIANVRIISGSHGHVVSVAKVHLHFRPFVVHRNISFYEPENSVMKRRIRLTGPQSRRSQVPGQYNGVASKYVHCVETGTRLGADGGGNQVLVEWGDCEEDSGENCLNLVLRYRCLEFPSVGSFYILLYNDPYQCNLYEIWQFSIHTRQKLDLHCTLGNATTLDLVVRGDRYARRARAWHTPAGSNCSGDASSIDEVTLRPEIPFQLIPGAYNRVMVSYLARSLGSTRMQLNVVDVDTRELISAWLLFTTAAAPAVMRSYDVEVSVVNSRGTQKKIIFKNPWDMSRKFHLVSSNENVMRPRVEEVDVAGQGSVYLKLWFGRGTEARGAVHDVYLFLNDSSGRTEECFLFHVYVV